MPDRCHVAGASAAGGLRCLMLACACAAGLTGCAVPPASPDVAPPPVAVAVVKPVPAAVPDPAPPARPAVAVAPVPPAAGEAVVALLEHADRMRSLPAPELTQEIARFGDASDSGLRQMQLAIALGQSRTPANVARAQALLQRVLALNEPENRTLHPLARLLAAQYGEQRRAEERVERQGVQLRDSQRRIDQLNERLEAVRAIERSLRSPPAPGAAVAPPAPGNGQRP